VEIDGIDQPIELAGPAEGGRVSRPGIVLVHKDELILPAEWSAGEVTLAEQDPRTAVVYSLPVEVEVVGALGPDDREQIVQETLRRLRRALRAQLGMA
jgi:hypothetical protein